ncbi:MAG: hypothetical protein ACOY3D_08200 [Candidatus Omnitrophota bacterium]
MAIRGNPQRIFCEGVKWGDLDAASFEQVVGYFKKRVEICFFAPVKNLLLPEYKTTGFIVLAVISAVIDILSQYYYWESGIKHKDKYKKFLRDNFKEFRQPIALKRLPHVKDLADFFYEGFRCQILHNFMLSEYSTLSWKAGLLQVHLWDKEKSQKEVILNPRLLIEGLENIFLNYIGGLLDKKNSRLRAGFARKLFIDTGVKLRI